MKIKWYCYICGDLIKENFKLFSMRQSTDRVFCICDKNICLEQIHAKEILVMNVKQDIL